MHIGIKATIYVDDGPVAAGSALEAKAKTVLCLWCVQLCGWNVPGAKSHFEPAEKLYYLGFVTDTIAMR